MLVTRVWYYMKFCVQSAEALYVHSTQYSRMWRHQPYIKILTSVWPCPGFQTNLYPATLEWLALMWLMWAVFVYVGNLHRSKIVIFVYRGNIDRLSLFTLLIYINCSYFFDNISWRMKWFHVITCCEVSALCCELVV